jgi:phosphoribosyl 1,2-cyclic phosphodiesterase
MRVRIWGTRGSYPVAGAQVLRYGGNTTCVEVRVGNQVLVLDAGTGLRPLGRALMREPEQLREQMHMLVTHTHWDHIIGFPFFDPLHHPRTRLDVYGLRRTQPGLQDIIANAVSDPLLPMGMERMRASLTFHEIGDASEIQLGHGVRVRTAQTNHPYRALAYRIESPTGILTFIPDTGPFHTVLFGEERIQWTGQPPALSPADLQRLAEMRTAIVNLAHDSDWLIYDTQFTEEQYARFPHWGHSTPQQAMEIAHAARVKTLVLFHHDPWRTDDELDRIEAEVQAQAPGGLRVCAAYEGMELSREASR